MLWSDTASRTVYTDVILYQRIWHDHDNRKTAVGLAAVRGARSVGGSVFSWVIVRGVDGWYNAAVFSAVNGTYIICCCSIRRSSIRRCSIRCSSMLAPRSGLVVVDILVIWMLLLLDIISLTGVDWSHNKVALTMRCTRNHQHWAGPSCRISNDPLQHLSNWRQSCDADVGCVYPYLMYAQKSFGGL